jgi:hypothetical protein
MYFFEKMMYHKRLGLFYVWKVPETKKYAKTGIPVL